MALKLVIEPIFKVDFQPCSYGFRPGRSQQTRPLLPLESQGVGQEGDGFETRHAIRPALQIADRLGAQAGSFGQAFLRQPGL